MEVYPGAVVDVPVAFVPPVYCPVVPPVVAPPPYMPINNYYLIYSGVYGIFCALLVYYPNYNP